MQIVCMSILDIQLFDLKEKSLEKVTVAYISFWKDISKMATNTQGMDSHGNTKLPSAAAAEGTLEAEKEAVVEHMAGKGAISTSNLNGMNSHGDTVVPEKAAEANIDRHLHGLHPQSSKE